MLLRGRADQALRLSGEGGGGLRDQARRGAGRSGGRSHSRGRLSLVRCRLPAPQPLATGGQTWQKARPRLWGCACGPAGGRREERLSSKDGRSSVLAEGGVEEDAMSGGSSGGQAGSLGSAGSRGGERGSGCRGRRLAPGAEPGSGSNGAGGPSASEYAKERVWLEGWQFKQQCAWGRLGGRSADRGPGRRAARGLP